MYLLTEGQKHILKWTQTLEHIAVFSLVNNLGLFPFIPISGTVTLDGYLGSTCRVIGRALPVPPTRAGLQLSLQQVLGTRAAKGSHRPGPTSQVLGFDWFVLLSFRAQVRQLI